MCNEFIIEVSVRPQQHHPTPTEDELNELEQILTDTVESFLDRLAESSDEDKDSEDEWDDD